MGAFPSVAASNPINPCIYSPYIAAQNRLTLPQGEHCGQIRLKRFTEVYEYNDTREYCLYASNLKTRQDMDKGKNHSKTIKPYYYILSLRSTKLY